ncbi:MULTISPECIES: glycoside hydrolase family 9 protein [Leptolyngbya]|uniref:glycoside hydrolase family 9 protein n=1 Tax=Leptolyngbya TaxID=47251 RepID=UPI001681EEE8|nr:glycoside hydrolase family 9 protein [Leptolyngbya sp. FACHB-1624]MBD1856806.1 glycoside hydrolase family 9 protein [Leptolyngbya sp. FACHB-1624]
MKLQSLIPLGLGLALTGCNVSGVDAGNRPQIKVNQAYLVKPDLLAIRIETGKIIHAQQTPYKPQAGDRIEQPRPVDEDWVIRNGKAIGSLVGKQRNILYPFDQFVPSPFDSQWADRMTSYRITSQEDSTYSANLNPTAVYRKSKPTDMARVGQWKFEFPMLHTMYLKLPSALKAGKTYQINFPGSSVETVSFKFEPNRTRSEAVHVSHIGFTPKETAKVAFLSTWLGNGGRLEYGAGLPFAVIDEQTNRKAFTGKTQLSRTSQENEDPRSRNYTNTNVYMMDFTALQTPGKYRVCVEAIGCSGSFEIRPDVWKNAFSISARGLYHQRSGIALTAPYTQWTRPRAFHPQDGTVVYQSKTPISQVDQGIGTAEYPKALAAGETKQTVPDAWGGYFDAGDWDRRIQHVEVSRHMLELAELFPNYFDRVSLNIPESKDRLPDVVNEALWTIDFFRRLQTPDGGIRGGIQSQRDPRLGEGSWQESYKIYAYAPDAWSSYLYAGVAARAAHWLKSRDAQLAKTYQESALRAMAYAERVSSGTSMPKPVRDSRNLAALELYQLTGSGSWHQIFLQTTVFKDPAQDVIVWDEHDQRDAAFLYARMPRELVDATVQKNANNALVRDADTALAVGEQTAFKWSKEMPMHPIGWGNGLGAPKAVSLVRAHYLSQNPKYLRSSVLATQFSLGANPDNMSYTTGVGYRTPRNPLLIDQRVRGIEPPPGITVYGPYDPVFYSKTWTIDLFKDVLFPAPMDWPATESYFDIFLFPMATEFTVMQSISPTAYLWGYLAAHTARND